MTPRPSRSTSAPVRPTPRVSAVVAAGGAGDALDFCLAGLLSDVGIDEVVVVDAGEASDVASALRALAADRRDVRLVQPRTALAKAAALNCGVEAARGRWVLIVDPSVVVQPGAVERMLRANRQAKAPAAISGLVGGQGRDKPGLLLGPRPASLLAGRLLLMARADLLELGGFQGAPGVDVFTDLSRRIAAAGGDLLVQPNALGAPVPAKAARRGVFRQVAQVINAVRRLLLRRAR
ncbi:MAG: glycosyltransferase [Hyphomonadaceae bacterium]|nr:glycosyltransferase [Hyphomonadaceae bacterium]